MEKKYNDLIISIIKQHKKYPVYESILEDIVNDVYEHSKVVLSSVVNEDVITAYLTKVVATSMVTVPKKLNFNTRANHRSIMPSLPEKETSTPIQEQLPNVERQESIETSADIEPLVVSENQDEFENTVYEETLQEEPAESLILEDIEVSDENAEQENEEEFNLQEENLEPVVEENVEDIASEEEVDNDETILEEDSLNAEEEFLIENDSVEDEALPLEQDTAAETVELEIEHNDVPLSDTVEVDKNLIDKMINGISESKPILDADIDKMEEDGLAEVYETLDEIDTVEENTLEDNSLLEPEDFSESLLPEEDGLSENIIEELPEESLEEAESDFSQEEEDIVELDVVENMALDIENNEVSDSTELIDVEELEPLEEIDTVETFNDTLETPTFDLEETEDVPVLNESTELMDESFSVPSYDNFSYKPEKSNYDAEEIMSYLSNLNGKYPEKRILEIFDLKYKQKLSVQEIMEKTGFEQEKVLNILNEIIDTVKD